MKDQKEKVGLIDKGYNTELAIQYGIIKATLLQNTFYWMDKNKNNHSSIHGFYYSRCSITNMHKLYPEFSVGQITRAMQELETTDGVLSSIVDNNFKGDKTKKYTIVNPYIIEKFIPNVLDIDLKLLKRCYISIVGTPENHLLPVTDHLLPVTNHLLPVTDHLLPVISGYKIYNKYISKLYIKKKNIKKKKIKEAPKIKEVPSVQLEIETPDIFQELLNKWNKLCTSDKKPKLARKLKINNTLKSKIKSRLKEHPDLNDWNILFKKIEESQVLGVLPELSWFNFDHIFKNEDVFDKIISGWMEWKAETIKPKTRIDTPHSPRLQAAIEDLRKSTFNS